MIEACFLDLDQTVIDGDGRLYDGLDAAIGPEHRTFGVTFVTARFYTRFHDAITQNPALAVTLGMPVALENGARVVNSTSLENIAYQPLSQDERIAACDFIASTEPLRYVGFHPEDTRSNTLLWTPDRAEAERLHSEFPNNTDILTGSKNQLFRRIEAENPCSILCRTNGTLPTGIPDGPAIYANNKGVSFRHYGVNKGVAAQIIADITHTALPNILAAGNGPDDLPMLQLEGLGYPVAVGPDMTKYVGTELPSHAVHVADPRNLGSYIIERAR